MSIYVGKNVITRYRTKSKNHYIVNGTVLKAVGTKVPDSVSKILNLGSYNFQTQSDSPFWLSETAGTINKNLNKVVNLSIMDKSIAKTAKMQRKAENDVLNSIERVESLQKELASFHGVDELKDQLVKICEIENSISRYREVQRKLIKWKEQDECILKWHSIERLLKNCIQFSKSEQVYTDQLNKLNKCSRTIKERSRIACIESRKVNDTIRALTNLEAIQAILERFQESISRLRAIQETMKAKERRKQQCLQYLKGKNCPVCRKEITSL